MGKSMKPGGGGKFAALESKLAGKPGIKNPAAVAASIGRKKFGGEQMAEMSARGMERAAAGRKGEVKPPLPKVKPLKEEGDGLAETIKKASQMRRG